MSMWHTIYFVDWNIVLDLHNQGILEQTLYSGEDPSEWAEPYHDLPISYNLYVGAADAYEQLRMGLDEETRKKADTFVLSLISFDGYHQDLDHTDLGSIVGSLRPETVIKLAILADEIDWDSFKVPYYELCDESIRDKIATYTNCQSPDKSFNKGFLGYIEDEWIEPIYMAARQKKGILIELS